MSNPIKQVRDLIEPYFSKQTPIHQLIRNNNITDKDNRDTIVKLKYANGLAIKAIYRLAPNPLMDTPDITVTLHITRNQDIRTFEYTTPITDNLENFSKHITNDIVTILNN